MANIILKINVKKLNKDWFFKGEKGTYADLVLYDNEGLDDFGNSHAIKQNPPKELREQGAKGIYVGNGKWMQSAQSQQSSRPPQRQQSRPPARQQQTTQREPDYGSEDDDSIPF